MKLTNLLVLKNNLLKEAFPVGQDLLFDYKITLCTLLYMRLMTISTLSINLLIVTMTLFLGFCYMSLLSIAYNGQNNLF